MAYKLKSKYYVPFDIPHRRYYYVCGFIEYISPSLSPPKSTYINIRGPLWYSSGWQWTCASMRWKKQPHEWLESMNELTHTRKKYQKTLEKNERMNPSYPFVLYARFYVSMLKCRDPIVCKMRERVKHLLNVCWTLTIHDRIAPAHAIHIAASSFRTKTTEVQCTFNVRVNNTYLPTPPVIRVSLSLLLLLLLGTQ